MLFSKILDQKDLMKKVHSLDFSDVEMLLYMMVKTIENVELAAFVNYILHEKKLKNILVKSASSTDKYHPKVSRGKYGLLNHTALALLVFDTFISFYSPQQKIDDNTKDVCRAGIILHDVWKYTTIKDKESSFTTKEHGFVGAKWIMRYLEEYKSLNYNIDSNLVARVASIVRYHMSNWCHTAEDVKTAQKESKLEERLVMLCDFIASNRALLDYQKVEDDIRK